MNERRPPPVVKFMVAVLCAAAGCCLWKPLGAYLAITSAGGLREPVPEELVSVLAPFYCRRGRDAMRNADGRFPLAIGLC